MPGSRLTRHELNELAVAADQEVRRNSQAGYCFEIRISRRIQAIGKQPRYFVAAETPWWKADTVNDNQLDAAALGTGITVGGGNLLCGIQYAIGRQ